MSKIQSGCNCDCMNCKDTGCNQRTAETIKEEKTETVKIDAVKAEEKQEGGAE